MFQDIDPTAPNYMHRESVRVMVPYVLGSIQAPAVRLPPVQVQAPVVRGNGLLDPGAYAVAC